MTTRDNGVFCVLPWIHLHSWPDGSCYQCCISVNGAKSAVGDLTTDTIAEIINNDTMKEVRRNMLAGKPVENCNKCYEAQKLKGFSWRNGFNREFQEFIPGILADTQEDGTIDPKLRYVDFRFSNLCNLGCRTCGAALSSKIAGTPTREFSKGVIAHYTDKKVFNPSGNIVAFENAKPNFFDQDLKKYLKDTKCYYFAGGEPLIQPEHFNVLSYIDENKWYDRELRYSTNLSNLIYKQTDFVEIWKKFQNVWLMCSIDHIGDKLEYIRQESKHDRIFKNFDRLVENKFKISIVSVISIYNIYDLYEFFEYLDSHDYLDKLFHIDLLYVFDNERAPSILPDWAKKELLEKLKQDSESELYKKMFKLQPQFEMSISGLAAFINRSPGTATFNEFIKHTSQLDAYYNKNIKKTFPWLGSVIDRHLKGTGQ